MSRRLVIGILIAIFGIAIAVESQAAGGSQVVLTPGVGFKVTTVITLVTGTMFLISYGLAISLFFQLGTKAWGRL